MKLPVEREPDGDRYLGHHFWVGIGLMILGWMQWSPHGTPEIAVVTIAVGLLVLLDDLVSHVFGVWTPLDALYNAVINRLR